MRWLVLMALIVGCSDGPSAPTDKAGKGEAAVAEATKAAASAKTIRESAAEETFDVAGYEKLLTGLAACEVGASGIARDCPAWKAFDEIRRDRRTLMRDMTTELAAVGRRNLSHESPAVRLQAARLASSLFGGDAESRDALVAAARTEQNPHVLRAMLRAVRSSIGRSDAVRDLLVQMADHPDEQVRVTVLGALSAGWAAGTEGTLEKVLAAVEGDPSPQVRAYACRQLGDRADERALPLLEKLTAGPAGDEALYEACFRGLIGMWAAPVPHKQPSEKAYRLTLNRLRATPRSEQQPPWGAIANLEWATKPALATAAPWYDKGELIEALADLAGDRQAHWLARSGAVKIMGRLGARRERLEQLKAGYGDVAEVPGVDKLVYDAVVEQLARRDGTLAPQGDPASVGETVEAATEAAGVPELPGGGAPGPDTAAGKAAVEALENAGEGRGKVAAKKVGEAVGEAVEDAQKPDDKGEKR
ncbi:MAG: hypothetical protein R3F65_19340 [bacterium]|nr:hypothetical protein [Myxococcales bacterium]